MGLRLEQIVPWGRSLAEYIQMFDLTEEDFSGQILDCGGGPASFNAELTRQGGRVISCDPVYQFSAVEIAQRITETRPLILKGVQENLDHYVWQTISSPDHLVEVRMAAMQQFLADFPRGLQAGRYRQEALPDLPFQDYQFDLALCSHLLFTYSDHLSWEFHQSAIAEMVRVAQEVRLFPLLKLSGELSPFVEPMCESLTRQGYQVRIKSVSYEFQRGGNQLLQVCSNG
jgi:hypothetical protein